MKLPVPQKRRVNRASIEPDLPPPASKVKVLGRRKITDCKWLNLYETKFEKNGKEGTWTLASRRRDEKLAPILKANAVVIVPILVMPNGDRKLVVIKEYRIPIETYEHHFPAGLLEEGESIENCVRRELKEEAGFVLVKINIISPLLLSSAGMTDESAIIVFVECTPGDSKQKLEGHEDIEVVLLSHAEVREWVKKPLLYSAKAWPVMLMYAQMDSLGSWNLPKT